jgi:hypothetical protein
VRRPHHVKIIEITSLIMLCHVSTGHNATINGYAAVLLKNAGH